MKHSQLPWKAVLRGKHAYNPDLDHWDIEHGNDKENVVDNTYGEENARLIVTACNSYYAMREALERYELAWRDFSSDKTYGLGFTGMAEPHLKAFLSAQEQADKALEQSKGE